MRKYCNELYIMDLALMLRLKSSKALLLLTQCLSNFTDFLTHFYLPEFYANDIVSQ